MAKQMEKKEATAKAVYKITNINIDDSGYRVVEVDAIHPQFGVSFGGTVSDYDGGDGIHPYVRGCDKWKTGQVVTRDQFRD